MASNLTALSIWEYLKVKVGAALTLNSGGGKEVVYTTDDTTGQTAVSIAGKVVQRRSTTGQRIASESTLGAELVTNGDCESFSAGLVTGWGEYDPVGLLTPSEETVDIYAGSKSQKLVRAAGADYAAVTSNNMALTKSKWYVASCAVKVISGTVRVLINTADSAVTAKYLSGALTTTDWTILSTPFMCPTTRSDYVFRFDSVGAAFTAIIDSVSIKEITEGDLNIADDLTVGGSASVSEGIATESTIAARDAITSGVSGAVRGQLRANRGAGATTPGVVILQALNGNTYYEWRTAAGRRRVSTALPLSDTEGSDAIDIEGALTVGGDASVGGALTVTGAAAIGGNMAATGVVSGASANITGNVDAGGNVTTTGNMSAVDGTFSDAVSAASLATTGNASVGGTLAVTGAANFSGAVNALLGSIAAGNYGVTRGQIAAYHGAGGNTPGYLKLYDKSGVICCVFAGIGGAVRAATAAPTLETDGVQVGASIVEGDLKVGADDSQEGVVHVYGDGSTKGGVLHLVSKNSTDYYFWVTDAGVLRRHTAIPTNWDADGVAV